MAQSIDLRINDFINEYLDYKGYTNTIKTFVQERQDHQEPIDKINDKNSYEKEKEKYKTIKVFTHCTSIYFLIIYSLIRKKC